MQTNGDFELIARFKKGDVASFGEIVLKYQDKIYNLCRHMLRNEADAEDARAGSVPESLPDLSQIPA